MPARHQLACHACGGAALLRRARTETRDGWFEIVREAGYVVEERDELVPDENGALSLSKSYETVFREAERVWHPPEEVRYPDELLDPGEDGEPRTTWRGASVPDGRSWGRQDVWVCSDRCQKSLEKAEADSLLARSDEQRRAAERLGAEQREREELAAAGAQALTVLCEERRASLAARKAKLEEDARRKVAAREDAKKRQGEERARAVVYREAVSALVSESGENRARDLRLAHDRRVAEARARAGRGST